MKLTTVPRPLTGCHVQSKLAHSPHISRGGHRHVRVLVRPVEAGDPLRVDLRLRPASEVSPLCVPVGAAHPPRRAARPGPAGGAVRQPRRRRPRPPGSGRWHRSRCCRSRGRGPDRSRTAATPRSRHRPARTAGRVRTAWSLVPCRRAARSRRAAPDDGTRTRDRARKIIDRMLATIAKPIQIAPVG